MAVRAEIMEVMVESKMGRELRCVLLIRVQALLNPQWWVIQKPHTSGNLHSRALEGRFRALKFSGRACLPNPTSTVWLLGWRKRKAETSRRMGLTVALTALYSKKSQSRSGMSFFLPIRVEAEVACTASLGVSLILNPDDCSRAKPQNIERQR